MGFVSSFLTLTAPGCASTSSLLVTRFSREHSCQADQVLVREASANEYLAEGCGQRTRYVCSSFAGNKASVNGGGCVEQGVVPQAGSEPPRSRVPPGFEEPPK